MLKPWLRITRLPKKEFHPWSDLKISHSTLTSIHRYRSRLCRLPEKLIDVVDTGIISAMESWNDGQLIANLCFLFPILRLHLPLAYK